MSQYAISVHREKGCFSSGGRLREGREGSSFPPMGDAETIVLLRFEDREAVTPSTFCMVAVRASQAGVDAVQLRDRCGVWGVTDADFTKWIESQGGELYRNDAKGVQFLDDEGLVASTWACKLGDHYGEGRYAFEAVAAALDALACCKPKKWIAAPDERLQAACR